MSERLTHQQQLERVRQYFQNIHPDQWGSGRVDADGFERAMRQRKRKLTEKFDRRRHENNLSQQVRLKLR